MTTQVEDGKLPKFTNQVSLPDNVVGLSIVSGAANTYGVWAVLSADIGSLEKYLGSLIVALSGAPALRYQFEIGIGGSGSEVAICSVNLIASGSQNNMILLDLGNITVPANSRLTIRTRDEGAAETSDCHITLRS